MGSLLRSERIKYCLKLLRGALVLCFAIFYLGKKEKVKWEKYTKGLWDKVFGSLFVSVCLLRSLFAITGGLVLEKNGICC